MTTLICDFQDIVGERINGYATLSAGEIRIGQGAPTVVLNTPSPPEQVIEGEATFSNVEPGAAVLQLYWDGKTATLRFTVPNTPETVTLSECVEQTLEYTPSVTSRSLGLIEGARNEALDQIEGVVAAEVGEHLQSISGPNLLNLDGALPGHALQPDGSVTPTPTRTVTDFIPVDPSAQYVWSVDGVPASDQQIVHQAFSADKELVGGQRVSASFDTTSATRFIRASILTDVLDKAQLEKGSTPTEYVAHGGLRVADVTIAGVGSVRGKIDSMGQVSADLTDRVGAVETLAGHTASLIQESRNLLDLTGAIPGMTLTADGTLSPVPTRTTTDFIPVDSSSQYAWSVNGAAITGTPITYQRYTADKQLIGGLSTGGAFSTTSTTAYVRASILNDVIGETQLEKGDTPTAYIPHGGVKMGDISLPGVASVSASIRSLEEQINAGDGSLTLVEDPPGSGLFVIGAP